MGDIGADAYNFASALIKDKDFNINLLTELTLEIMQHVNSVPIQGSQKKEIVLDVLDLIIEKDLTNDQKLIVQPLRDVLIPNLIDQFISIKRGEWKLDPVKEIGTCISLITTIVSAIKRKRDSKQGA